MPPQNSGCSSASVRPRPHRTACAGFARSPSSIGWALRVTTNNFGGDASPGKRCDKPPHRVEQAVTRGDIEAGDGIDGAKTTFSAPRQRVKKSGSIAALLQHRGCEHPRIRAEQLPQTRPPRPGPPARAMNRRCGIGSRATLERARSARRTSRWTHRLRPGRPARRVGPQPRCGAAPLAFRAWRSSAGCGARASSGMSG